MRPKFGHFGKQIRLPNIADGAAMPKNVVDLEAFEPHVDGHGDESRLQAA